MADEQRLTNRIPFEDEVTILSPQKVVGVTIDIGAGGIGIEIPVELTVGDAVEMAILSGHAITYGTIQWIRPQDGKFRTGIMFRKEDWSIIELVLALRSQEG